MEVNVIRKEKNELELNLDNGTVAEILRVYLNQGGAELAVWRKVHPSKPIVMKIQSSGKTVNKEISDAISSVKKDLNKILSTVKK